MKTSVASMLVGAAVLLLLLGVVAMPASAAPFPVPLAGPGCPTAPLLSQNSYILTGDLAINTPGADCITINGNGTTVDLNGHSISGVPGTGRGITAVGNNHTIKGPGIVHDFDGGCIIISQNASAAGFPTVADGGRFTLVENVLAYNCAGFGIRLGSFSKCVQCRVHDVRLSEGNGVGIEIGFATGNDGGCLLESSIVERSDIGVLVGTDCKVWDLVVDTVGISGLVVGAGTTVARTVISHYHNGPGLDYTRCGTVTGAKGCQDSSNSVTLSLAGGQSIADAAAFVITDCATNGSTGVGGGIKYVPTAPTGQCSP